MFFTRRNILTEALEKGTVVRFKMPLFICDGDRIVSIKDKPDEQHYAVVIKETGEVKGKEFKGHDMIKLHHTDGPNPPEEPYLQRSSFIENQSEENEIRAFYNPDETEVDNYYSRPNENDREKTICSFHDDCEEIECHYVGKLTEPAFSPFEIFYNTNKNNFKHLLIDKSGEPYYVRQPYKDEKPDKPCFMTKDKQWVTRSAINESLIMELESQPGIVLLLIPDELADELVFEENPVIIRRVIPHDDYTVQLNFNTGERGVYDVLPLISQEITDDESFSLLEDLSLFNKVQNYGDSIAWNNDAAIDVDELYGNCMTIKSYNRWRDRNYR